MSVFFCWTSTTFAWTLTSGQQYKQDRPCNVPHTQIYSAHSHVVNTLSGSPLNKSLSGSIVGILASDLIAKGHLHHLHHHYAPTSEGARGTVANHQHPHSDPVWIAQIGLHPKSHILFGSLFVIGSIFFPFHCQGIRCQMYSTPSMPQSQPSMPRVKEGVYI